MQKRNSIYLFFVSNRHQQSPLTMAPETYSKPRKTSKMELSAKILTNFHIQKLKVYVLNEGFKNTYNFNNFPG